MPRKWFNTMALDANYQIVSLLVFSNLQWNRKYHETGTFSIQIPLWLYSPEMKYIYTKDRPELGRISQVNYIHDEKGQRIHLSGYFEEKDLDRHVVYPPGTSNILNPVSWIVQSGAAEDVAYSFFDGFKNISTSEISSVLNINAGSSQGRGKTAVHTRNGELLGKKIYNILKPSGMSYRVLYDLVTSAKSFDVWSGLDRTDTNAEGNNPIVFSTKYGNIKNPNVLISSVNYKNACIVTHEQQTGESSVLTSRAVHDLSAGEEVRFTFLKSALQKSEYTDEAFIIALDNEGHNEIAEHPEVFNIDFDALEGSYEYMVDFDLGDKCSIEIPEIGLSIQARLIGCYEVMKSGKWTMEMEFGTPIIIRK